MGFCSIISRYVRLGYAPTVQKNTKQKGNKEQQKRTCPKSKPNQPPSSVLVFLSSPTTHQIYIQLVLFFGEREGQRETRGLRVQAKGRIDERRRSKAKEGLRMFRTCYLWKCGKSHFFIFGKEDLVDTPAFLFWFLSICEVGLFQRILYQKKQ